MTRQRWNEMDRRRRRAWWLGFAAAYVVAAIMPAIVCTGVGVGLAAAGLRERTGNGASAG